MKSIQSSVILITLVILTGCASKVYFTQEIRERIDNTSYTLDKLQFYNDIKITLFQELILDTTKVEAGELQEDSQRTLKYLIIKPGTPGRCDSIGEDIIGVSFDSINDKSGMIYFGKFPDPSGKDTLYKILALQWINDHGKINFHDSLYYILPESRNAALMIERSTREKSSTDKKEATGARVSLSPKNL